MSKIFKRLLCALLGLIVGTVSTLGAVAATVYYTYGNLTVGDVSGNKYKDALGDLNSFSIEDIIGLGILGGKSPENYTFADLEKDYGFDLVAFINQLGGGEEEVISTAESNQKYIDDLKKTSVFTLFNGNGFQEFVNNLSYGAVLSFIPVNQLFAEQERLKLRKYTLGEMNQKDAEGQTGLVKALRNVRVGGVLPRIFDYDEQTDKYSVKEGFYKGLNVIANVELDSFIDIVNKKSDWATEICEGGLSSVGKLSVSEILELCQVPDDVAKRIVSLVGDLKTRDLFVKNDDGKYEFKADNLYDNIKVGGALGLEYRDDGLWYNSDGTAAKGIFQTVASVNLKSLIHAFSDKDNNDALSIARKVALVFGNFSVGNALEMIGYTKGEDGVYKNKNGEEPKTAILSVLSDLKLDDVFYGSEAMTWGRIRFKLMSAVKGKLIEKGKADMTVGEAFGGIIGVKTVNVDGKVTFTNSNGGKLNAAFEKMLATPVMDYVDALGQETFEKAKFLAFANALMGDIKLGYFVGADDASGKWLDKNGAAVGDKYVKIYDITLSQILVPLLNGEKNPLQLIVDILGPSSTVGEYVAPLIGVTKNASGEWDYTNIKVSQLKRFKFAFNKVFDLTLSNFTSKENAMTAVKDAFRHARLGELAGYTRNEENGSWNFNNARLNRFSAVIYKLFDIELSEIAPNGKPSVASVKAAVKNAVGDMAIGEAAGYTKGADGKWNFANEYLKKFPGVANALLDIKLKDCTSASNIKAAVKNAVMSMTVGDAMGYTKDENGKWRKADGTLLSDGNTQDKMLAEICDKTLQEVYDNRNDLTKLFGDVKAGDLMNGYVYCDGAGDDCEVTSEGHVHDKGWYKNGGKVGALEEKIADMPVEKLLNDFNIDEVLDGVTIGETMNRLECTGDETTCKVREKDPSHVCSAKSKGWYKKNADGKYVPTEDVLMDKISGLLITDLMHDKVDLNETFKDTYLGEVMKKVRCNGEDDCNVPTHEHTGDHVTGWYKKQTDEHGNVTYVLAADGVLMEKMSDQKLGALMDGSLNLEETFKDVKLGEVMKNVYCDGSDGCEITHTHEVGWYKKNADGEYAKVDVLMQKINEQKLGNIMNGGMELATVFDGVKLGEVLKYDYDGGVWKKEDKKVGAIENAVADILLSDMLNGNLDLSSKFDDIYLGELMGYEKDSVTGKWSKNGVELTDEVLLCVVDFTFNEVKSDGFSDKMLDNVKNKVTIGTVLVQKDEHGNVISDPWKEGERTAISVIPKDTQIGKVSTAIQEKMQHGTAGDLYDAGLLPLQGQQEKMDKTYGAICVVKVKTALADGSLDRESKEYLAVKKACGGASETEPTDAEVDTYINGFSIVTDMATMKVVVTPEDQVKNVGNAYWRSLTTSQLVDVLLDNASF